jgi:hypothetical protein
MLTTEIKVPFAVSLTADLSPNDPAGGGSLCHKFAVLGAAKLGPPCTLFFSRISVGRPVLSVDRPLGIRLAAHLRVTRHGALPSRQV